MWSKLPPAGLPFAQSCHHIPPYHSFVAMYHFFAVLPCPTLWLRVSSPQNLTSPHLPFLLTHLLHKKPRGGNSDNTSAAKQKGSAKSKEGNSDYTSAAKQKGSDKSKDGPVAKQKGSASSKETAKGADLTYKSAKGADLSKYVRSSLKPIESSGRVPDTASAMGAENSASVSDFKAAFIVSAFVAVGAALSAV